LAKGEPGAEIVSGLISLCVVGAVNHCEIVSKLTERDASPDTIRDSLKRFNYRIVDFDADLAFRAGVLWRDTRALGLSLGDRACLALAQREGLPVFTADKRWAELDLGVDIRVIR